MKWTSDGAARTRTKQRGQRAPRRSAQCLLIAAISLIVGTAQSQPAGAACDELLLSSVNVRRCVVPGGQSAIDAGRVVRYDSLSTANVHWLAGHRSSHGGTFRSLTNLDIGDSVQYRSRTYTIVDYDLVYRSTPGRVLDWMSSSTQTVVLQTSYSSSRVHVWRAIEQEPPPPVDVPGPRTTALGTPSGITLIDPTRVLDTRWPTQTFLTANEWRTIQIPTNAGVPSNATALFANITAIGHAPAGFITATSCDQRHSEISSVNWSDTVPVANQIVVPVRNGTFCVFAARDADLIIDVTAYASSTSSARYQPVEPVRLLDTRTDAAPSRHAAVTRTVQLPDALRATDPLGVFVSVTTIARGNGYATAHPCDQPFEVTSTVNMRPGAAAANGAIVAVDDNATFCVSSFGPSDLTVDVVGLVATSGGRLQLVSPTRLVDTRRVDSSDVHLGFQGLTPASDSTVKFPGQQWRGLPDNMAIMINVTTLGATSPGFVTLFDCGSKRSATSTQNPRPGSVIASGTSVTTASGTVCAYLFQSTHLIVDVVAVWV